MESSKHARAVVLEITGPAVEAFLLVHVKRAVCAQQINIALNVEGSVQEDVLPAPNAREASIEPVVVETLRAIAIRAVTLAHLATPHASVVAEAIPAVA